MFINNKNGKKTEIKTLFSKILCEYENVHILLQVKQDIFNQHILIFNFIHLIIEITYFEKI